MPDAPGSFDAEAALRPLRAFQRRTVEYVFRRFYKDVPGIENLRVVVYGRDDVQQIPAGAPTYVTQSVRARLGDARIPGRILPAARTIASESARAIFSFILRSNIEAMSRVGR